MSNSAYFFLPNVSLFGAGCLTEIGAQAVRLGVKKLLLVTDRFLAGTDGAARICQYLRESGVELEILTASNRIPPCKASTPLLICTKKTDATVSSVSAAVPATIAARPCAFLQPIPPHWSNMLASICSNTAAHP